MKHCPFIFLALLTALLFGGASEARGFTRNQASPASFHVYAGGQLVCSFETNSTLFGGSDTNRVAYYYHEDDLNSSTALSSGGSSGSQIEVNAYYPFGRVMTASPQASFKVSRQFTGQIKDDDTGLCFYNTRYYDPLLDRFIQADTMIPDLGNPQSYNRYSYCLNNPLKYTDPSGHDFVLNAGLVAGPVPYMTAKSTLGQIGAGAYNMFPLVDNSIHLFLTPVARANDVAEDALETTTQAVTGDPQLAKNSRNLTLLVGIGEVGKIAKLEQSVVVVEKAQQTYEIVDGVRRAKAAELLGNKTIPAQIVNSESKIVEQGNIAVDSLRSPNKTSIDMSSQTAVDRYMRVQNGTKKGEKLPPITVTPGNKGIPVKDVQFNTKGDDK